jgi:DNA replication initiation complex subunit (GINS family)
MYHLKIIQSKIRETQPKETSELFREIPMEFYQEIRMIF